MKWKEPNAIISTNITTIEIYVYQPLTATGMHKAKLLTTSVRGLFDEKKKKKRVSWGQKIRPK